MRDLIVKTQTVKVPAQNLGFSVNGTKYKISKRKVKFDYIKV